MKLRLVIPDLLIILLVMADGLGLRRVGADLLPSLARAERARVPSVLPDDGRSCTIFVASMGDKILFGNNEDYYDPDYYYWVDPAAGDGYDVFYLGAADLYPQGAVNEERLAFDASAILLMPLPPRPERPVAPYGTLQTMMRQAATVEEAIAVAGRYDWGTSLAGQFLVADASGDAVVIGPGSDGELAFTRKTRGDGYLASTNFNRAYPSSHYGDYPCWRYDAAVGLLSQIKGEAELTVDAFREILNATHQEGPSSTIYSNVIDLRQGVIYFYYGHDYAEVFRMDMAEQMRRGTRPTRVRMLFSPETRRLVEKGWPQPWRTIERLTLVAWAWFALTVGCLGYAIWSLLAAPRSSARAVAAWVLTIIVFGPFGLAVYLLSRGATRGAPAWLRAMGATMCRTAGYLLWVAAVFVYHIGVLRNFKLEVNVVVALVVAYALPFLFSLLAFAAPHVASRRKISYWHGVRQAALREYLSFTLALVSVMLTMEALGDWLFPGALDYASPVFWLMLVIVALAAALAAYPVSYWAARGDRSDWPLGWISVTS